MRFNTSGECNAAVGGGALCNLTTGCYNVALGFEALYCIQTNCNNVAVGKNAMRNLTAGDNNIAIGADAQLTTTTTSNEIRMGNASHTAACIQIAWTVVSDMRDKTNIGHVPHGLQFIEQLEPISYQFRTARDANSTHGPVRYGFSAQQTLAAEGGDLERSVIVHGTEDRLGMTHEYLIPVLVNAVKELSEKVKVLQAEIALLKK